MTTPSSTFQDRAKAFLKDLEVIAKKHDVAIFGHDGMGEANMAVVDGCQDFDASDIDIFSSDKGE